MSGDEQSQQFNQFFDEDWIGFTPFGEAHMWDRHMKRDNKKIFKVKFVSL